jgi:pyruvate kinase
MIRQLIEAGASTFRLNFSHGTHADHHRSICNIRQVSSELNQPVGILQDLQGPKIRLGVFKEGPITLNKGDKFTLTSRQVDGNSEISCITYDTLAEEVPIGAVIMLDDFLIVGSVKPCNSLSSLDDIYSVSMLVIVTLLPFFNTQ